MDFSCTVFALFHGDYPELVERFFNGLARDGVGNSPKISEFRFGLNGVRGRGRDLLQRELERLTDSISVPVSTFEPESDVGKYPLMRQMFEEQFGSTHLMWFDDDSYLDVEDPAFWWASLELEASKFPLLGSVYSADLPPEVRRAYFDKLGWTVPAVLTKFVTGGWWLADQDVLLRGFDYPPADMGHSGGDLYLGLLCRRFGIGIGQFRAGVRINWGPHGESSAPTRGRPRKDVYPVNAGADLGNFAVTIRRCGKAGSAYVETREGPGQAREVPQAEEAEVRPSEG